MDNQAKPQTTTPEKVAAGCALDCPRLKWLFRLLISAQFVICGLMILVLPSGSNELPTRILAAAAVALGGWAIITMGRSMNISPQLKSSASLKTSGPYRFLRHPMYTALLVLMASYAINSASLYGWALWFGLLIVLATKIYYEERMLRQRFSEYATYSQNTQRLIPYIF